MEYKKVVTKVELELTQYDVSVEWVFEKVREMLTDRMETLCELHDFYCAPPRITSIVQLPLTEDEVEEFVNTKEEGEGDEE